MRIEATNGGFSEEIHGTEWVLKHIKGAPAKFFIGKLCTIGDRAIFVTAQNWESFITEVNNSQDTFILEDRQGGFYVHMTEDIENVFYAEDGSYRRVDGNNMTDFVKQTLPVTALDNGTWMNNEGVDLITVASLGEGYGKQLTSTLDMSGSMLPTYDYQLFHTILENGVLSFEKNGHLQFDNFERFKTEIDPLMVQSAKFQVGRCAFQIRAGAFEEVRHYNVQNPMPTSPRVIEMELNDANKIQVKVDGLVCLESTFTFSNPSLKIHNKTGQTFQMFRPNFFKKQVGDYALGIVFSRAGDGVVLRDTGVACNIVSGNLILNNTTILSNATNKPIILHIKKESNQLSVYVDDLTTQQTYLIAVDSTTDREIGMVVLGSLFRGELTYSIEILQSIYEAHAKRSQDITGFTTDREGNITFNTNVYKPLKIMFSPRASDILGLSDTQVSVQCNAIKKGETRLCVAIQAFPVKYVFEGDSFKWDHHYIAGCVLTAEKQFVTTDCVLTLEHV